MTQYSSEETIWTISALNFKVKGLISSTIGRLWIEGEVSNFVCPASGHWYFSLKDERAQCRAAMFKGQNSRLGFTPKNGQRVLVKAQVTLYEARGEYQLILDHMEEAGVGELMLRYQQLKKVLEEEGLLSAALKKKLPKHPRHIALVTSTTGAAVRDVLSVIRRRAPYIPVTIFPTLVQGEQAAEQIRAALSQVQGFAACDLVLLVRGGGSLEDLWCFNDEGLARDIAGFPIPLVTGIGHETDFTIADFVADYRAPTPSVAAEATTPDRQELMQTFDEHLSRMLLQIRQCLIQRRGQLMQLHRTLNNLHPQQQLRQLELRLNFATDALIRQMKTRLEQNRIRYDAYPKSLQRHNPFTLSKHHQHALDQLYVRSTQALKQSLSVAQHGLSLQIKTLDTLSPLKTLSRGFAAVSREDRLIHSAQQLDRGDEIQLTFKDGSKQATVQ